MELFTMELVHEPNFEKERLLYKFLQMIGNIRANFHMHNMHIP